MKLYLLTFFAYFLLLFPPNTFAQKKKESWTQTHWLAKNKIELSITYEGSLAVDGELVKAYSLMWNDTVGQSMNYPKDNRPFELKVVIRTKDGIVGRYTGLSTQMTNCSFLTNSEWVSIHFWLEQNVFFELDKFRRDSLIGVKNAHFDYRNHMNFNRREYAALRINTRKIDANNIVDGYDKKAILLEPNDNIVRLFWINKGALNPNPMPNANMGLSTGLRQVFALDRYLLNIESGKIKLGKKWLRKYGIVKTSEMQFRVIDPHLSYTALSGEKIFGKTLIKSKGIDIHAFDSIEFKTLQWSLPYSDFKEKAKEKHYR